MNTRVRDLTRAGWAIAAAVAFLYLIGLASIYATEAASGRPIHTWKQMAFGVGSLLVAYVILRMGFRRIHRHAYLIFALALVAFATLASVLINPLLGRVVHWNIMAVLMPALFVGFTVLLKKRLV